MVDGKHTVFGKVVQGQSVVDSIIQNDFIVKVSVIEKAKQLNDLMHQKPNYFEEQKKVEQEKKKKLQKNLRN